jgi:hypothetical protein
MSKSECEALAFYQQCFSDYYLYKQPYEWDRKRKLVVKVTRSWDVWIHRLHIPIFMAVSGLLAAIYVILHKRLFPAQSELPDFAEFLLYQFVAIYIVYIPLYEVLFHIFDEDIFHGINQLLVFNRKISTEEFTISLCESIL